MLSGNKWSRCHATGPHHIEPASKHQRGKLSRGSNGVENNVTVEICKAFCLQEKKQKKNVSNGIKQNTLEERKTLSHTTLEAFAFLVFSSPSPGVGWGGGGSLGAKAQHAEFLRKHHQGGFHIFSFYFTLRHPSEL